MSTVNSGKSTTAGGSATEMLHHQSNLCMQLHHQLHTTRQQNASSVFILGAAFLHQKMRINLSLL
jgi:3-dehydroquinate dehydratase